jgi:hypothetical protein
VIHLRVQKKKRQLVDVEMQISKQPKQQKPSHNAPDCNQNPESVPVREWREVARDRHVRAHEHAIATGHRQTHAFIMGITQADGKAASSISVAKSRTPKAFIPSGGTAYSS